MTMRGNDNGGINPSANEGLNNDAEELYLQELWEKRESQERKDVKAFNDQFQDWANAEQAKEEAKEKGWSL